MQIFHLTRNFTLFSSKNFIPKFKKFCNSATSLSLVNDVEDMSPVFLSTRGCKLSQSALITSVQSRLSNFSRQMWMVWKQPFFWEAGTSGVTIVDIPPGNIRANAQEFAKENYLFQRTSPDEREVLLKSFITFSVEFL